ncbi:signal peptidase I [Aeoliella mucimassa]|uniref:Signal peptidase I n=1 Tax=Aeoliella mucimassa TaxID=2527972 RepID=A0A518AVI8_9BACT|nr:signal peptidase I [Aeoliella mucimassa]QDU58749.1 signal peptidase I [Aeoliella mucimassa]
MAKNNKKKSGSNVPLPSSRKEPEAESPKPNAHPSQSAVRETFESLAIAFILAFLIRTFVVEPFVIPTGSMSPALRGVHKDLECPQCGHRYRVNASQDMAPQQERCVGGMCPMCRYTMAFDTEAAAKSKVAPKLAANEPNYSGDRIIVNKFQYSFQEPERWDVVVFKYPGNATQNYIKRLVGLPEETLRIFGGDLFVRHVGEKQFTIARKPPATAYAMRQEVHDNQRNPRKLREAGWPYRWQADDGWKVDVAETDRLTHRTFQSDKAGEQWLRYFHTPPDKAVWPILEQGGEIPSVNKQLVSDFNSYNTRIMQLYYNRLAGQGASNRFEVYDSVLGMHWVGDLYVDANVEVQQNSGELMLELVESGQRFRATIDLKSGQATLGIIPRGQTAPASDFAPVGETPLMTKGSYRVVFGNVDDTLRLWIDDKLVEFDSATTYDWEQRFGNREDCLPYTSDDEPGDLSPARVGTNDALVAVNRLRVERDIYYIADKQGNAPSRNPEESIVSDYGIDVYRSPAADQRDWDTIATRQAVEFPLKEDQFFVMGDNSPQSSDARLWYSVRENSYDGAKSQPGGNYLERQLLIGRAISVVWPHPWYHVVPNVTDMRRIR